MSDIREINKQISFVGVPNPVRSQTAIDNLNAAFSTISQTAFEASNAFFELLAADPRWNQIIDGFIKSTDGIVEGYYLNEAEPAEVVQYIVRQPDHTWKGVTIYPDEAWRYEHKSDWMWWRQ